MGLHRPVLEDAPILTNVYGFVSILYVTGKCGERVSCKGDLWILWCKGESTTPCTTKALASRAEAVVFSHSYAMLQNYPSLSKTSLHLHQALNANL